MSRLAGNVVFVLLLGLLGAGCASMTRDLETPRFSVLGLTVDEVGLFEQRFGVRLRVQNPNDIALPVKGISLNLDIQGEEFARGVSAERFDVPAFGESEFTMRVSTNLVRSAAQLGGLLAPGTEEVDYRVDGKVSIDLPFMGSVPFDAEGSVRLTPAPR
jgi:LEA14-like dessication related protein